MSDVTKQIVLKEALQEAGFDYEFVHASNIVEPLLLIKNYAPSNGRPVSFAFTLLEYYRPSNAGMGRKCWMTHSKVKAVDNKKPNPHPNYQEFEHENVKYHPFSLVLAEHTYDAESIRELCKNLYGHLDFEENS